MNRTDMLELLDRFGGRPFRARDAEAAGLPRYSIYRLRDRGDIVELARGVYQVADATPSSTVDLATVSARVPSGTICLNSSLAYWDLSDEIPVAVHIAVPRGAHRPVVDYPPTEVHVFAADTFGLGRVRREGEDGAGFWIYDRERSVVDAMRMAREVGRDQAYSALRRYLSQEGAQPARLAHVARQLRTGPQIDAAMEVLLS